MSKKCELVSTYLPMYEWEEERKLGKFKVMYDMFESPAITTTLSDEWKELEDMIHSFVSEAAMDLCDTSIKYVDWIECDVEVTEEGITLITYCSFGDDEKYTNTTTLPYIAYTTQGA